MAASFKRAVRKAMLVILTLKDVPMKTTRWALYIQSELRPFFRTVCLLTLRGHFPSHIFESLFWRFVADA